MKSLGRSEASGRAFESTFQTDPQAVAQEGAETVCVYTLLDPVPDRRQIEFAL